MEPLVEELIKNHKNDKDLTGAEVQEELKKLRQKHNRVDPDLENNEQLVGLDWREAPLDDFHFENTKLSMKGNEKESHFERANLSNAHFENADLSYAWINQTNVRGTSFEGCKFYGLDWEDASYFEFAEFKKIDESDIPSAVREYFNLERYFKEKNRPERVANFYFYRKRLMTKRHLESWTTDKRDIEGLLAFVINRIWEFFCGYGERPRRVVRAMFLTILFSAFLYHFIWGGPLTDKGMSTSSFWDSLYFSGVTFTTLGFGDFAPNANYVWMKFFAFGEALFGAFLMALLVVVLARKMIR